MAKAVLKAATDGGFTSIEYKRGFSQHIMHNKRAALVAQNLNRKSLHPACAGRRCPTEMVSVWLAPCLYISGPDHETALCSLGCGNAVHISKCDGAEPLVVVWESLVAQM